MRNSSSFLGSIASLIGASLPAGLAAGTHKVQMPNLSGLAKNKPAPISNWGNNLSYIDKKELHRRVAEASDFNRSLETKKRRTKSGKLVTRVIPHPGTLVMGSR